MPVSQQSAPTTAAELTLKMANAIRPILAFRALEEIGRIQPAVVTVGIQGRNPLTTAPRVSAPVPAYRVMWDWEMDNFKAITRSNLPAVFRCGELSNHSNGHYVDLTKAWQFFWFDLCCKIYYGRYHQDLNPKEYKWLADKWTALGSTERAFTNLHGLDKFQNYVLDTRLNKDKSKIYTLVCGGASLAGTIVRFPKGNKSIWMLKVVHFDGTLPPPPVETIDPYTDPRVFFATTITKAKVKNPYKITVFDEQTGGRKTKDIKEGYKVNPFPQFKTDTGLVDCPVPIVANKDIYYPLKDLVAIDDGVKPRPYFQ